jgi:hypothetical protein
MIDFAGMEDLLADSEAILLEPRDVFDSAILGIMERDGDVVAVYSIDLILDALQKQNGSWDRDDALEWYGFNMNIQGKGAPAYLDPVWKEAA